ncbi:MAG: dihydrolipoamide acetyltransferase, partial [Deltaproteobacteria bacterium]|nr:dihydrolipoamide acetyltransferase [Deltaproteobacteria bacterium]
VLTGPISPGSHTLSVVAIYRGHGYGVFRYLNKYKFTVKSSHTFTADEGKGTSIVVKGFEKGGATTPMEKRPAIDFKVSVIQGGKK